MKAKQVTYYNDWNELKKTNVFKRIIFVIFPNKYEEWVTVDKKKDLEVIEQSPGTFTIYMDNGKPNLEALNKFNVTKCQ